MAAVKNVGRKLPFASVSWSKLSWAIPQSQSTMSKQCFRLSSLLGEGVQLQLYLPLQYYHWCCWLGFLSSTGHCHAKQLKWPQVSMKRLCFSTQISSFSGFMFLPVTETAFGIVSGIPTEFSSSFRNAFSWVPVICTVNLVKKSFHCSNYS